MGFDRQAIEDEFVDWYNTATATIGSSTKRQDLLNEATVKFDQSWRCDNIKPEMVEVYINEIYGQIFGLESPRIQIFDSPMALVLHLLSEYGEFSDQLPRATLAFNDYCHNLGILKYCLPFCRWGVTVHSGGPFSALAESSKGLIDLMENGMRVWSLNVHGRDSSIADEVLNTMFMCSICQLSNVPIIEAICNVDEAKYRSFVNLSYEAFWSCLFQDRAYIVRNPVEVNYKNEIPTHLPDKPIIKYRDGFGIYKLNNIFMPAEIVETPAEELDPNMMDRIDNADVRREFIRKIGYGRIFESRGGTILAEDDDGYKIVELDPGDGQMRRFLYMVNPSVGEIHLEGIPGTCAVCDIEDRSGGCPFSTLDREGGWRSRSSSEDKGCDTVEKARFYRNGTIQKPELLT